MPFATTWMELENIILSEMSQKDKDKYHMISPAQMNISSEKKIMDLEKRLWLPDGRGRECEGSGAWANQTQPRIDLKVILLNSIKNYV